MLELVELRLQVQGLLQILQELSLECDDLVDVAKQGVDLGIREECLAFHGLQIVLQQIVQVLQVNRDGGWFNRAQKIIQIWGGRAIFPFFCEGTAAKMHKLN